MGERVEEENKDGDGKKNKMERNKKIGIEFLKRRKKIIGDPFW